MFRFLVAFLILLSGAFINIREAKADGYTTCNPCVETNCFCPTVQTPRDISREDWSDRIRHWMNPATGFSPVK
ncbi:MAG: hypothetical protein WC869_08325 [Phycisphaerae bacterium]